MKQKKYSESRHFGAMWKHVKMAREAALAECDDVFRVKCNLCERCDSKLKPEVEKVYRKLRAELKVECYFNEAEKNMLDGRKMGAIMCNALIRRKYFTLMRNRRLKCCSRKKKNMEIVPKKGYF